MWHVICLNLIPSLLNALCRCGELLRARAAALQGRAGHKRGGARPPLQRALLADCRADPLRSVYNRRRPVEGSVSVWTAMLFCFCEVMFHLSPWTGLPDGSGGHPAERAGAPAGAGARRHTQRRARRGRGKGGGRDRGTRWEARRGGCGASLSCPQKGQAIPSELVGQSAQPRQVHYVSKDDLKRQYTE